MRKNSFKDKSGQIINGYKVIRFDKMISYGREIQESAFIVKCKDCGKEFSQPTGKIGKQGCGCMKGVSHNLSSNPAYSPWKAMRARCNNPNHKRYVHYGGKGIKVCERWDSFEAFLADMGERPSLNHTIERRDNNVDYMPSNCYWLKAELQPKNRTYNKLNCDKVRQIRYMYSQKVKLKDIAEVMNCSISAINHVVRNRTWTDC